MYLSPSKNCAIKCFYCPGRARADPGTDPLGAGRYRQIIRNRRVILPDNRGTGSEIESEFNGAVLKGERYKIPGAVRGVSVVENQSFRFRRLEYNLDLGKRQDGPAKPDELEVGMSVE